MSARRHACRKATGGTAARGLQPGVFACELTTSRRPKPSGRVTGIENFVNGLALLNAMNARPLIGFWETE